MVQRLFSSSTARVAGNVATLGFLLVILLQILLAFGVLPITMAWGGSQTVLTPSLQLASAVAAVILAGFAYVIRRRAGLLAHARASRWVVIVAWVITGYMTLNTLGNIASSSTAEKLLFGPLSLLLACSCLLVAASRSDE